MRSTATLRALLSGISCLTASAAMAQAPVQAGQQEPAGQPATTPVQEAIADDAQSPDAANAVPEQEEEIVVVGTNIRGADVTGILPVTVLSTDDIEATGATSGDELFRAIPQAADVAFNEGRDTGGINDARGDVASINLRALGTGNTLVLLNGRRMVLHPGTQAENLVPVQSVNTNAIPVTGVRRIEVLRDGASAIYGTDAVAGVINTVLKDRFDGFTVEVERSITDHSMQDETEISFEAGHTFNEDRTNISIFGAYTERDPLFAFERRNSRSSDMRPLFVGTPFEDDVDFDNRSTDSIFGEFLRLNANFTPASGAASVIRYNNVALTSATNPAFHVQPDTNPGCIAPAGPGICFDNATLATTGDDRNLRYDTNTERTIQSELKRLNLFGFVNHDFSDTFAFFGEVGYYNGQTESIREQETSLANQRLIVPANNPYNPIGSGPGRLPLLTGVPAAGAAVELQDYRPVDVGPLTFQVENESVRFLAGFRGEIAGFDWESAALYSESNSIDTMQTISATAFQQALSRTGADAYNPFNGGSPTDPSRIDSTPNGAAAIQGLVVDVYRENSTTLSLADLRVSRNDLFRLPGGNVGFAVGTEYRHETYVDNRDPRLDGTISFVALDGSSNGSDVLGASPTPDSEGSRNVFSAFAELAVPIVSPDMDLPLIHSIDLQVAGRYEHYSTFGSVAKPRVALSYFPVSWLQFRGAWSQGFRAPGLPQLFENGIQRSNTRTDWIRCEADLRAGRIANFDDCGRTFGIVSNRSGSQDLVPEESENLSLGVTLQPPIPDRLGRLTATFDYWEIDQKNIIGLFGDANALTLDYLLRLEGSSNPNVQRTAPTPQEVLDFAGTGIAPVGRVIQVIDNYTNLSPRTVRGYDIGINYSIDDTGFGDFDVRLNAARLLEFFQEPGELQAQLIAAQEAGTIDDTINITGAEDLVRENGRPKWRASATVTWRLDGFGLGYFANYVSSVIDTGATLADGTPFRVDDYISHSLYAQYEFRNLGPAEGLRLRVGVRNLFDTEPPLADATFGYLGELHSIRGRSFYASLRVRF